MNAKELRAAIYQEIGDASGRAIENLVNRRIRDGIRTFNRTVGPVRTLESIAVTLAATSKDLGAEFGKITSFYTVDGVERHMISLENLQDSMNDFLRNPEGLTFFAQEGQTLYFDPAISSAEVGNASAVVEQDPPYLTDETTDLDVSIDEEAIIAYSAWKILSKKKDKDSRDRASVYRDDYNEKIMEALEHRSDLSGTGAVSPNQFYRPR